MDLHFIEITNGFNWGKVAVGRFTAEEWSRESQLEGDSFGRQRLLQGRGWSPHHIFVLDLETGEGGLFSPGGYAKADLDKHAIWVCPMFEPFLKWLYKQDLSDISKLPHMVKFTEAEAPSAMYGYRRPGPDAEAHEETA